MRSKLPAFTQLFGVTPRQLETDFALAEIPYYLAYLDKALKAKEG